MRKSKAANARQVAGGIATWCAFALSPAAASGQLSVFPVQDLSFGLVQPGVPEVVLPSQPTRRAEFDVVAGRGTYIVQVTLPASLVSATLGVLPLSFSNTDGVVEIGRRGKLDSFDPKVPYSFKLNRNDGGAAIYIGGTAVPSPTQQPGLYSATMTIMITNSGV